jgi:hypothetical protein
MSREEGISMIRKQQAGRCNRMVGARGGRKMRPCDNPYKPYKLKNSTKFTANSVENVQVLCESGFEYLHHCPESSTRDGKETQCLGIQLGHPVPGGYKYGDVVLQVGEVSNLRQ